ncbi:cyclin-like protein [Cercophora newfieldiana]|uniref:Cyclin-like protein n=1 Tax=Cercophora newfieldiana TaxID=92897 RepID=A0AA39XRS1_9PEZI|nr:cyclin-like protein [Cercophora newfieldiana]
MDAKPQRPLRVLQGAGNENLLPSKPTAHQRHKSTGNLKTMTVAGALNAPPRRTAFGDLSNTVRTFGEIGGKNGLKNPVKSAVAAINLRDARVNDKENNPAQIEESWARSTAASRASLAGSKYLQTTGPVATTSSTNQIVKPAPRSYSSSIQPSTASLIQPAMKQTLPKKATMVYFDKKDTDVLVRPDAGPSIDELAGLTEKPIKNPRHYKSQPQLKAEQPVIRRTQSRYINKCEKITDVEYEIDLPDDVTEAAYEDAVEQIPTENFDSIPDQLELVEVAGKQTLNVEFAQDSQVAASTKPANAVPVPAPAVLPEVEEYWDEDEEQELYDEQGYTTAHSYRSHGDNTTQGVTTLVAPKVTVGIERELEMAKVIVMQNQSEEEVEEEAWDVSMVAEYGDEIFTYMRQLESSMIPNPYYMDIQTEIQWSMRSVLMDWLVQVHHRFGLLPETLFLTVNYIDRFLSVKIVSLNKLQLVGATAIFVAAKYEEINCPSVQEIVYMVDSGYTVEEILKAERFMLSMLQFELGWPGPMSFLRRISKADDYDLETRTLAKYFLEVTIMDERFVGSPPSYLAAGAHCLSRLMLKKGDWTAAHIHYSGYTITQLKPLVMMILDCCQDGFKHHSAVYDKYSSHKYKKASTYVENEIKKGFQLSLPTQGLLRSSQATEDDSLVGQSANFCHIDN